MSISREFGEAGCSQHAQRARHAELLVDRERHRANRQRQADQEAAADQRYVRFVVEDNLQHEQRLRQEQERRAAESGEVREVCRHLAEHRRQVAEDQRRSDVLYRQFLIQDAEAYEAQLRRRAEERRQAALRCQNYNMAAANRRRL